MINRKPGSHGSETDSIGEPEHGWTDLPRFPSEAGLAGSPVAFALRSLMSGPDDPDFRLLFTLTTNTWTERSGRCSLGCSARRAIPRLRP